MATRYGCVMQRSWSRFLAAAGLFWAVPAMAQAANPPASELPLIISLDAADCRRLVARSDSRLNHQPNADVTYRPGRDVDSSGRPIAPADLPGSSAMPLTGPLELPINLRLSDLLGSRTPPRTGFSELNVARVGVDPMSGRVTFNGEPLEPRGEDAVTMACREYLAGQAKPR